MNINDKRYRISEISDQLSLITAYIEQIIDSFVFRGERGCIYYTQSKIKYWKTGMNDTATDVQKSHDHFIKFNYVMKVTL